MTTPTPDVEIATFDIEIKSIGEVLRERGANCRALAELGTCLWREWEADFRRFCNITGPQELTSFFVSKCSAALFEHYREGEKEGIIEGEWTMVAQERTGIAADVVSGPAPDDCGSDDDDDPTLYTIILRYAKAKLSSLFIGPPPQRSDLERARGEFEVVLPSTFIAVHKASGAFVGTATLDVHDMMLRPDLGKLWLANVYVVPQYRNMGIGLTLVNHATDYARQIVKTSGCADTLHLWTFTEQLAAWYGKHCGFTHVCRIAKHGHHENLEVMQLAL